MANAARALPVLPPPEDVAIQQGLNDRSGIDEGEAYILARALEDPKLLILTGDGKMVRALHQEPYIVDLDQLRGRIILFPHVIGALVNHLSLTEVEYRWRKASPEATKQKQKSLSIMFGSSSPTQTEEFWSGYRFQISHVTDVCGADWLCSL
jgi:hypothetical protein